MRNIILKDGMLLLIGTAFNTIAMLLMQVILARKLELESYGTIITSFNLINLLALTLSLGIADYFLSVFGKYRWQAYKVVRAWLKFFPILVIVQLIILIAIYFSNVFSKELAIFMLLILPNIIVQGLLPLASSIFQVQGKYIDFVIVNFSIYFVRLVSVVAVFFGESKIYAYGSLLSIFSILVLVYLYYSLKTFCSKGEQLTDGQSLQMEMPLTIKIILRKTMPYAILGFCFYGFHQSNILLINVYLNEEMVALYNSAFTIITMAFILPNIIVGQLFNSKVHHWANNDFAKVTQLFFNGTKKMLVIAILVSLLLLLTGKWIILMLFGQDYSYAANLLKWLLLLIPFRYMQAMGNSILNTESNIIIKCKIYFVVSVISIASNIILIPKLGISGVVISAFLAECILLLLTLHFSKKFIIQGNRFV